MSPATLAAPDAGTASRRVAVPTRRPTVRALAVVVALLAALVTGIAPAGAVPATGSGWLRVMHLSPDTGEAAVTLTAVNGSLKKTITGVKFGDASDYLAIPVGSYVISLRPARSTQVILERSITVPKDQPMTMTVTGAGGKLKTQLYTDDLVPVPAGQARVRVLQAASVHPTVTVKPRSGSPVLSNAATGTPAPYRVVPAGPWTLTLQSGSTTATSTVTLASGASTTVLVLDTAKKSLTVKAVVDSEAVSATPKGGVDTGAAPAAATVTAPASDAALGLGALALVCAGTVLARRREADRA